MDLHLFNHVHERIAFPLPVQKALIQHCGRQPGEEYSDEKEYGADPVEGKPRRADDNCKEE